MGLFFLDGDVEEAWTKFKDLFFASADQCIPSFTLKRKRTKSWLSDEVLTLRKRRACRIANAQAIPTTSVITSHCVIKLGTLEGEITISIGIQSHSGAGLKTSGGATTLPDIHYQGNTLSSALEKANALNNFFTSVFTKEVAVNVSKFRSAVEIKDVTFSADDVYDLICATDPSKSSVPYNIPGRLQRGSTVDR